MGLFDGVKKTADEVAKNLADETKEVKKVVTTERYEVITNTSNLNVRKSASETAEVIGSLPKGTIVELINKDNAEWFKVKFSSGEGFCSSKYLKKV